MATQTFSCLGVDDDAARAAGTTYPPPTAVISRELANATLGAWKAFASPTYTNKVAVMRWDTSSLPAGVTITGATLRIYGKYKQDNNARSIMLDWYLWNNTNTDYIENPAGNANAGITLASLTVNALNDIPLSGMANINRSGLTGLRAGLSGGVPTLNNWFQFASGNDTANPVPQLIVTYDLAAAASIEFLGFIPI